MRRLKTVRRPPIYPKTPGHLPCSSLTHPLPLSSRRPSVSFGGFGLNPQSAETYDGRGRAYSDLGEPRRGIQDYDQAILLNPNYAEAVNNRAP